MSALHANFALRHGGLALDIDMQLPAGRITALLGPSGSGKTTVLRVLAGLLRPDAGSIDCRDQAWYDTGKKIWLPPQHRNAGVVFQDYALFDHLTVAANIGYGVPKARRGAQVADWLQRLHLTHVAEKFPAQLSGGQRQRTALGRALAISPRLLLLDEPFSAVDFALRHRLRVELWDLIEAADFPVLLVSHDLDEVRQLASRVYILDEGEVLQYGATEDIFSRPESRRVAQIAGWKNLLQVRAVREGAAQGAWGMLKINASASSGGWLGVRPEHLVLVPDAPDALKAVVRHVTDFGAQRELTLALPDGSRLYMLQSWRQLAPSVGEQIAVRAAPEHLHYWPDFESILIAETLTL